PGETISYGILAARIGQPTAVRAVGLANGANPIAIVVPCHRVIGANGALTGFGGGIERKRWLLAHERVSSPQRDELISESEGIYDGCGRPFAARRAYGTRSTYQEA
ncbi:MAG: methylated-DNA--[protein]-cysteine S-methyltransferase, partial [Methylocella sp.]